MAHDLPNETDFLRRQDEAQNRIMEIVEMPDRLARNLVMFLCQNGGVLSKRRRENEFRALTNDEVAQIESVYRDVFGDDGAPSCDIALSRRQTPLPRLLTQGASDQR